MIEETLCPKCGSRMKVVQSKGRSYWLCKVFGCGGTRDNEGRSKEDREREREENMPNKYRGDLPDTFGEDR